MKYDHHFVLEGVHHFVLEEDVHQFMRERIHQRTVGSSVRLKQASRAPDQLDNPPFVRAALGVHCILE